MASTVGPRALRASGACAGPDLWVILWRTIRSPSTSMPRPVDLLVLHAHLFTLSGEGVGYVGDGAVAIEAGLIVDVGRSADLEPRYQAARVIDATGRAVLPGLIDAHMHTRYAVVRGVAQDVSHWMQKGLAPFARHLTDEAARAGTRLNVAEAVLAGTTTLGDFLDPYPGWAECFVEMGVRACLTPTINALPRGGMARWRLGELYPLDDAVGRQAIGRAVRVCETWDGAQRDRIRTMLGPQGPDMLGREQLLEVHRLARDRGLTVHMHVAQGDREIEQVQKRYGLRTPAFLDAAGLLDEHLLAVHLTEASEEETDLIAGRGARMVVCSGSIGIIDGIVPPARRFREAGGRVALGSDQASGNNCNNIFNEMKLTALFNKIDARDPRVMPAWEVLRMATIEGATALGMEARIGSLEEGKEADLIVVDLSEPNLSPVLCDPVRTIVPNLVYAGTGKEVHTVVVAGRIIVEGRRLLTADLGQVVADAQREAERVARAVRGDPLHRELALLDAMDTGRL